MIGGLFEKCMYLFENYTPGLRPPDTFALTPRARPRPGLPATRCCPVPAGGHGGLVAVAWPYRYPLLSSKQTELPDMNTSMRNPIFRRCSLARCKGAPKLAGGRGILLLLSTWALLLLAGGRAAAQTPTQLVRLAKIEIYPAQLQAYKTALREEIEASLRLEPGVLTLYAVAEKDNPTRITILEIYASTEAYKAHLLTPQFLKYKAGTTEMVKSLELVETVPLMPDVKVR